MVGIGPHPEDGEPHLGYWIGTPHWGEGYATEAARALIDAFFAYTEAASSRSARVINPASRRVLEKCGFAYLGSGLMEFQARGGLFPVDHFRLDRRAWESLKTWGQTGFVRERRRVRPRPRTRSRREEPGRSHLRPGARSSARPRVAPAWSPCRSKGSGP